MNLQHYTVRLSIDDASLPPTIQIIRHDSQFRLHLSNTRSEPIHLVTYLGRQGISTDDFSSSRTTGDTRPEYQVIEPAGPKHYLVRLTFYPFYPPDGQIRREVGGQGVDKLWYGDRELRIYAWCGAYGETGPLPYQVVDERAQVTTQQQQQAGCGGGPGDSGNDGDGLRGGNGNRTGGPAVRAGPVELPAQALQPAFDPHVVNQVISDLCEERTQPRLDGVEEQRRQEERDEALALQLQIEETERVNSPPWWPW